jgi:hypothetical protein
VKSSSRRALASIDLDQNGGYQQCYQSQAAARDRRQQKGIVMEQGQTARPTYGALYFLVRYGDWVAAVFALAPLAAGALAWVNSFSIAFLAAGIVAGAFAYLIMRSYVELVRVIVDMLLPK